MGEFTNILYECLLKYETILGKTYKYELDNGIKFELRFKKHNFPHLIGLHYLKDINEFNKLNNKNGRGIPEQIYRAIRLKKITYEDLLKSAHINKIESRIYNFLNVDKTIFTNIIVNFNKAKLKSTNNKEPSKLKSNMILYTKKNDMYLHLCICNKNKLAYPESFFVRNDKYYTKNQIKRTVKKIIVFDNKTKEGKEYIIGD